MHRGEELFNQAIGPGAEGVALKDSALTEMIAWIKTVAAGSHCSSHALTSSLLNRRRRPRGAERQASLDPGFDPKRAPGIETDCRESEHAGDRRAAMHQPANGGKHPANICQKLKLQGSHSLLKFALQDKSPLL
jgi:hypothetical protein